VKLPLYWIDAFTNRVFAGNPAGVVPLERWLPDDLMQRIAFEHGLAETAFFVRLGAGRFHVRWFTPAIEDDLCGHATLAAAFVIFNELREPAATITFDSRAGPLTVTHRADGKLELDFPSMSVEPERDPAASAAVAAALGRQPVWLGRSRLDRVAVLEKAETLAALHPDGERVAAAGGRGLIVTAPGTDPVDFVYRFFAPQHGIPEDSATGSAQCTLMPYWVERLGRSSLHSRQLSPRGAEFWSELAGERVRIAGEAVLYLRGEIQL
jgi:PhzF family phenazine biosynthesis protein